jgi:hypothetical protein
MAFGQLGSGPLAKLPLASGLTFVTAGGRIAASNPNVVTSPAFVILGAGPIASGPVASLATNINSSITTNLIILFRAGAEFTSSMHGIFIGQNEIVNSIAKISVTPKETQSNTNNIGLASLESNVSFNSVLTTLRSEVLTDISSVYSIPFDSLGSMRALITSSLVQFEFNQANFFAAAFDTEFAASSNSEFTADNENISAVNASAIVEIDQQSSAVSDNIINQESVSSLRIVPVTRFEKSANLTSVLSAPFDSLGVMHMVSAVSLLHLEFDSSSLVAVSRSVDYEFTSSVNQKFVSNVENTSSIDAISITNHESITHLLPVYISYLENDRNVSIATAARIEATKETTRLVPVHLASSANVSHVYNIPFDSLGVMHLVSSASSLHLEFKYGVVTIKPAIFEFRQTPLSPGPGFTLISSNVRDLISPAVVRKLVSPAISRSVISPANSRKLPSPTVLRTLQVVKVPDVGVNFGPADSGTFEQDIYSFDFTPRLSVGEGITSVTFTLSLSVGTDPAPASHAIGNPTINGSVVSQLIGGLLANRTYLIIATITTSAGRTITASSHVAAAIPS